MLNWMSQKIIKNIRIFCTNWKENFLLIFTSFLYTFCLLGMLYLFCFRNYKLTVLFPWSGGYCRHSHLGWRKSAVKYAVEWSKGLKRPYKWIHSSLTSKWIPPLFWLNITWIWPAGHIARLIFFHSIWKWGYTIAIVKAGHWSSREEDQCVKRCFLNCCIGRYFQITSVAFRTYGEVAFSHLQESK